MGHYCRALWLVELASILQCAAVFLLDGLSCYCLGCGLCTILYAVPIVLDDGEAADALAEREVMSHRMQLLI